MSMMKRAVSILPNDFKRIKHRFIAGAIIAGLSLAFMGGCENDRTGYITKTFVSPSGEYQAEVVQVSLGATGGWSAVFFETDNG